MVLGCNRCWGAGFSPREALQTAPGPRCSGPRAVLDIPTLLPWTPQPPLHWNGPHRHSRDKGWDCHRHDGATEGRDVPPPSRGGCGLYVAALGGIAPARPCVTALVPWWAMPRAGPCPGDGCSGDLAVWELGPTSLPHNRLCLVLSHPHAQSGGTWISISLFIRGVNTPV